MIIVLTVICILTGTIIPVVRQQIKTANLQKLIKDMETIAEAGRDYYKSRESSPGSISELSDEGFLRDVSINPFGFSYTITCTEDNSKITTTVPSGHVVPALDNRLKVTAGGGTDTIEFYQLVDYNVPEGKFEKKWLYEE